MHSFVSVECLFFFRFSFKHLLIPFRVNFVYVGEFNHLKFIGFNIRLFFAYLMEYFVHTRGKKNKLNVLYLCVCGVFVYMAAHNVIASDTDWLKILTMKFVGQNLCWRCMGRSEQAHKGEKLSVHELLSWLNIAQPHPTFFFISSSVALFFSWIHSSFHSFIKHQANWIMALGVGCVCVCVEHDEISVHFTNSDDAHHQHTSSSFCPMNCITS